MECVFALWKNFSIGQFALSSFQMPLGALHFRVKHGVDIELTAVYQRCLRQLCNASTKMSRMHQLDYNPNRNND
jgi:hypothetical protein